MDHIQAVLDLESAASKLELLEALKQLMVKVRQFLRIHCRSLPQFPHKPIWTDPWCYSGLATLIELESHLFKIHTGSQSAHG